MFLLVRHALDFIFAGAVACVVSLYWYRVMRMAVKIRRKNGLLANVLPKERTGRLTRWVWTPVVAVWLIAPWLRAFGVTRPWMMRPIFYSLVVELFALVNAIAAYKCTRVCWRSMGASWRMGIDPNEKTRLILHGPFGRVRHPIYGLSSVLMIATVLVCPTPLLLVIALLHLLLLQYEARREEQHLLLVHGFEYQRYKQATGRFIPRRGGIRAGRS